MTSLQQYKIVNGPSKFDFAISLFREREYLEFSVVFSLGKKERISVTIYSISCLDKNREIFSINGFYKKISKEEAVRDMPAPGSDAAFFSEPYFHFRGEYNTKTRTGFVIELPR